jgi:hypothetical protein
LGKKIGNIFSKTGNWMYGNDRVKGLVYATRFAWFLWFGGYMRRINFILIFFGIMMVMSLLGCENIASGTDSDDFSELLEKSDSYHILIRSFGIEEYNYEVANATNFLGDPYDSYPMDSKYSTDTADAGRSSAEIVLIRNVNDKWPTLLINKRSYYAKNNQTWILFYQTAYYVKNRSVKEILEHFSR